MNPLNLQVNHGKSPTVLCIGAHCDDIEIGCGGTLLKLADEYKDLSVKWIVFASNEVRKKEAQKSAEYFLENVKRADIEILSFNDGFLPSVWSEVKHQFEKIKSEVSPDLIFTHYRHDLHQDHRTLNELTWNTFRDHFILEYEILKYDGDMGNPNVFVSISNEILERKKQILLKCYESQLNKQWFDETLLTSLPRIRGVQSNSGTKFAEAFYGRKCLLF